MDRQQTPLLVNSGSNAQKKRWLQVGIIACLAVAGLAFLLHWLPQVLAQGMARGSKEGQACIQCHSAQNAALVEEWVEALAEALLVEAQRDSHPNSNSNSHSPSTNCCHRHGYSHYH